MYRYFRQTLPWIVLAALVGPGPVSAQEHTQILVRVIAKDAKIIGTSVGGAHVTVRDLKTSRILAEGVQEGSTGSTDQIMGDWVRGASIFESEGAGSFLAELDVSEPTQVLIEARGPLGAPHAEQFASKSLLVIPGHHVLGEGVIIELNGFTVELQSPTASQARAGEAIAVKAKVTMLCGCPTQPGGRWDSNDYELTARIVDGTGAVVAESSLTFAGTTSEYEGSIRGPRAGDYQLQVIASDAAKGNFGIVQQELRVR